MKTLLVGNGINIQFGGKAYTSKFIIERMKCRAAIQKYDVLFEDAISGNELVNLFNCFVDLVKRILDGECDDFDLDCDLKAALEDFKSRYDKVTYPNDIMLEDWLFVLKMYSLMYDSEKESGSAEIGFKRLFLDAIFNDGKIQNIYQNMGKKVCRFLKKFDEIYTVNYDTNLESATSKQVFHLHGTFTELQASENPEYVIGYQKYQSGKSIVIPSFEHSFCNALLSYSGDLKYKEAMLMHRANIESESVPLLKVLNIPQNELKQMLITHKLHPELKIAPEYYFDRFEQITGELDILGMSPNNDQHIINIIKNNPNITRINFYCYTDAENKAVHNIGDIRFKPEDAKKLWQSLGVEPPKKYGFNFPKNFYEPINAICKLSDYQATEEEIKQDIMSIPPYEIKRLCDETFKELEEHDALYSNTKDLAVFKKNFAYISHIATKEGILPPSLLSLLILNLNNYN